MLIKRQTKMLNVLQMNCLTVKVEESDSFDSRLLLVFFFRGNKSSAQAAFFFSL